MTRTVWLLSVVGLLLVNAGCGTLCKRKPLFGRNDSPAKAVYVPPPPPGPLVPAGATFGPPGGAFPTVPAPGNPATNFPTAPPSGNPPSITPTPSRYESKWQPIENRDTNPRIQLYAPETIDKEKIRPTDEPPASKKPSVQATFPAIPQFAEVRVNTYAGLRPPAEGLDWLQANRIGAVVQVRLFGADDSADRKQVEDRNMRYIAFEISPATLTKEKADEFIKLIRDHGKQGIFIYDKDGSLAGAMWYLHLRWGEILDDDAAQLRARPLGLQNTRDGQHRDMWLAVQKLLSENSR